MVSMDNTLLADQVEGLYRIIPLKALRRTKNVTFDMIPIKAFGAIAAVDRVLHEPGALSPGSIGEIERPWYMHPHQDDNLVVLTGTRHIDLYTKKHGIVEHFTVTPHEIYKNNNLVTGSPALLAWPTNVFHRILSDEKLGSASMNFAVHYAGFDIKTNFNVYDLNTETGEYRVIRAGSMDQPENINKGAALILGTIFA